MSNILGKIFGTAGKEILTGVADVVDKFVTTKEEKEQMKIEMQKVINQHIQEMYKMSNDAFKTEVEDRASARTREAEFLKATGHVDYMMYILAFTGLGIFCYLVYSLLYIEIPQHNEGLIIHTLGIIEGIIVSMFSYYFGSSAGSRLKDKK